MDSSSEIFGVNTLHIVVWNNDLQIPENEEKNIIFYIGYYNNKWHFDVTNESKVKFNRVDMNSIGLRNTTC